MKRSLFFLFCLLMSMQIFSQNEISKEMFPTLAGLERTVFVDTKCEETSYFKLMEAQELVVIDGKDYLRFGSLFLREEDNKVLIYSWVEEKDFVLYDWTLEVGDELTWLALDQTSSNNFEYPVIVDYIVDSKLDENGELVTIKEPTEKLKLAIKRKLGDINDKLIDEQLVGVEGAVNVAKVVYYSAMFNYNLKPFVMAITKAGKRGWIWPATVGLEVVGKHEDAKIQ